MFSAMHRRLALWLAGLFVIAQIFGVVSLMNSHAVHVAEAELVLSDGDAVAEHHRHDQHRHYRGDADGAVQHHELHDLNGALPGSTIRSDVVPAPIKVIFSAASALSGPTPTRLERPPKTFLSV